jgi:hypothetical protein
MKSKNERQDSFSLTRFILHPFDFILATEAPHPDPLP